MLSKWIFFFLLWMWNVGKYIVLKVYSTNHTPNVTGEKYTIALTHMLTHLHTYRHTQSSRPLQAQWGVLVRFKAFIVPDQPTCLPHSPALLLTPLHLENCRKIGQEEEKGGQEVDAGEMEEEKKKKRNLHICLGTMSVPTIELVGLKKEADLAASAVKWFSGLTVADATDSPAPLGACKFSQAWILSKYTYRLPLRCRKERKKQTNNNSREEGDI